MVCLKEYNKNTLFKVCYRKLIVSIEYYMKCCCRTKKNIQNSFKYNKMVHQLGAKYLYIRMIGIDFQKHRKRRQENHCNLFCSKRNAHILIELLKFWWWDGTRLTCAIKMFANFLISLFFLAFLKGKNMASINNEIL